MTFLQFPNPASAIFKRQWLDLVERLFVGYVRHIANKATAVTPKSEEYRAKARECEECAEQTRDPFLKQQFIDTAGQWRTMAAYEEKYAR